ncbi:MAG TPA: hypothetical protein VGA56_09215 [Opitutaceae bacterium]
MFATGCARTYDVNVNAIHDPSVVGGKSYRIMSRQPGLEEGDPNYSQAVELVKNALGGHGMYEAPNPENAEVIVLVDYGVGPVRTEIETERDISSSSSSIDPMMGAGGIRGMGRRVDPIMDPNSVLLPSGRVARVLVPEETVRVKQVYDKHLSISAREAKVDPAGTQRTGKELWRVDVTVEQGKDDMVEVLPVLAAAVSDYIETDTGSRQSIRIAEDSPSVVFVKGER